MSVHVIETALSGSANGTRSSAQEDRNARFERLISEHIPVITRIALLTCWNRETAEDVVQETLLRAWRHLDKLREPNAAKGWLFQILRNERNRVLAKMPPKGVDIDLDALPGPGADPDVDAAKLRRQVGAMPEKYATPLTLFAFKGYKIEDISEQLGIKRATVKTRLFRAREKLREGIEAGAVFG